MALLLPSPLAAAQRGLKRALSAGVVSKPVITMPDGGEALSIEWWLIRQQGIFWAWANERRPTVEQERSTRAQGAFESPKSSRYQEHTFPVYTATALGVNIRVEVAQFPVQSGRIGVIRAFEQYLSDGSDVLSELYGNPINGFGRWLFRLDNFYGTPPARLIQTAPFSALPGLPYEPFPGDDNLWFPAGSCTANNIRLLVPGRFILRVFWESGAGLGFLPSVAAKLRGSIQNPDSEETIDVIRSSWA